MTDLPETNDLPQTVARLSARLEALEQRIAALERWPVAAAPASSPEAHPPPRALDNELPDPFAAGAVFSVLGRAMLGIAGAYVLRAAAQANLLPREIAAALAIPYALAWLVWAARAPAWLASAAYASTSALILAPMLWELTLRFNLLSPWAAAAVLAAFVGAATLLAWRRRLASVYWVANASAVIVALSLALASRAMEPFVSVLLVMLLFAECAAACDRQPGVRALAALAADAAIWAMIYAYVSPPASRLDYPNLSQFALIAPGVALFVLFTAGLIYRTAFRRKPITVFEIVQTMIVFFLAACGLVCFGPANASAILCVACLVLSAAAYAAVFLLFNRAPQPRNYRVFATWSAALFLGGSLLYLPHQWKAPCLGIAAIAATFLGARLTRVALEFHGAAYLLAAAAASGLAGYSAHGLAGSLPAAPAWSVSLPVYAVFACAVLCYAALRPREVESWQCQALDLLFAVMAVCGAAGLIVRGLMALAALGIQPGAHHLAFFRTVTVCAVALALAYSGARWRRRELTRIGYSALALMAVKLVAEDLRHGHLEYIAGSIFLYALTLIAVPRIARLGQKA